MNIITAQEARKITNAFRNKEELSEAEKQEVLAIMEKYDIRREEDDI